MRQNKPNFAVYQQADLAKLQTCNHGRIVTSRRRRAAAESGLERCPGSLKSQPKIVQRISFFGSINRSPGPLTLSRVHSGTYLKEQVHQGNAWHEGLHRQAKAPREFNKYVCPGRWNAWLFGVGQRETCAGGTQRRNRCLVTDILPYS
jgi:hypothetical protein